MNVDGAVNGVDVWHVTQALQAGGERALANPNGPVHLFVDPSGNNYLSAFDEELLLRLLTNSSSELLDEDLLDMLASEQPTGDSGLLDSGGESMSMMTCPTVTLYPVAGVNEGSAFGVQGLVSPPGSYFIQGNVNWGSSPGNTGMGSFGTAPNGSFTIPHIYFDDGPAPGNGTPHDTETVTLTGMIFGCPVSANTTVTINNTNPLPQLVLTNANQPVGGPFWDVSGSIDDASMSDVHDITINWGDGSPPTLIENKATGQQFETDTPHRYPPRQIHEELQPYYPTASVVDDDTGGASWQGEVPVYKFDLDNDADNNELINAVDDPLEDFLPGRFVAVNYDDDNQNNLLDLSESGVSGEDDLEPFQLAWMPRPGFNYTGWRLTLDAVPPIDPASGTVWQFADKSGWSVPFTASSGLIKEWVLGTGSVIETYYLEAADAGEIAFQLRLWTDYGLLVEEDTVGFTAVALGPMFVQEHYWGDDAVTWFSAQDPLWSHDEHRWTTTVAPTWVEPYVSSLLWMKEVYVGQLYPIGNGQAFAQAACVCPVVASPGFGDWFIYPVAQIGPVQAKGPGERKVEHEVVSVEWEGVDPGDGETNLEAGDPSKLYPERNHPVGTTNGNGQTIDQVHNKIKVKVTIKDPVPAGMNAKLRFRVYDPDNHQTGAADPNDPDENTNKPGDNVKAGGGNSIGISPFAEVIEFEVEETVATKELTITETQPGNNYIVAAHSQQAIVDNLKFKDDSVSLFYRKPGTTTSFDVPATHRTEVLEVWRTLWVESDHMEAPGDDDGPFNGDAACGGADLKACDDVKATPTDPTIDTLTELMNIAFVTVKALPAEYDPRNTIPFDHNLEDTAVPNVRDEPSSQYFWTVHMLGAYEFQTDRDNDPHNEPWFAGWSEHLLADDPTNFVFDETVRDIHAEPEFPGMVPLATLLDRVSAHEAFHRFFGWHGTRPEADEGIMNPLELATAAMLGLTDGQIRVIQQTKYPK